MDTSSSYSTSDYSYDKDITGPSSPVVRDVVADTDTVMSADDHVNYLSLQPHMEVKLDTPSNRIFHYDRENSTLLAGLNLAPDNVIPRYSCLVGRDNVSNSSGSFISGYCNLISQDSEVRQLYNVADCNSPSIIGGKYNTLLSTVDSSIIGGTYNYIRNNHSSSILGGCSCRIDYDVENEMFTDNSILGSSNVELVNCHNVTVLGMENKVIRNKNGITYTRDQEVAGKMAIGKALNHRYYLDVEGDGKVSKTFKASNIRVKEEITASSISAASIRLEQEPIVTRPRVSLINQERDVLIYRVPVNTTNILAYPKIGDIAILLPVLDSKENGYTITVKDSSRMYNPGSVSPFPYHVYIFPPSSVNIEYYQEDNILCGLGPCKIYKAGGCITVRYDPGDTSSNLAPNWYIVSSS